MTPDELNDRFAIDNTARFVPGDGGLPRLDITSEHATASVYTHGAHVANFQPVGAAPVLWMSGSSVFESGRAIRGGVPVIFPWFGDRKDDPDAPAHGLVRQADWTVRSVDALDDGRVQVVLAIAVDPFDVSMRITVGRSLSMQMTVANTSDDPANCEQALHTYLTVGDIKRVGVQGLAGAPYIDKVDSHKRKMQSPDPISFNGETDSVYLDTNAVVRIVDEAMGRTLVVGKTGSRSTIVWNPWIDKASRMGDFGDDEWPGMLCVETANVADNTLTLEPGGSHVMTATIGIE